MKGWKQKGKNVLQHVLVSQLLMVCKFEIKFARLLKKMHLGFSYMLELVTSNLLYIA
jgi:hypothetical protein